MKNFWDSRKVLTASIFGVTLLVTACVFSAEAVTDKLFYYKRKLGESGVRMDLAGDTPKLELVETEEYLSQVNSIEDLFNVPLVPSLEREDYLVLLSSESDRIDSPTLAEFRVHRNIVLICDTDFTFGNLFSCGYDYVNGRGANAVLLRKDVLESRQAVILDIPLTRGNLMVIPEVLLITPKNQDKVVEYFRAIGRSNYLRQNVSTKEPENSELWKLSQTTLVRSLVYMLSVVAIGAFLTRTVLANYKRFLDKGFYRRAFTEAAWLIKQKRFKVILVIVFLLMSAAYLPLARSVFFSETVFEDVKALLKHCLVSLKPGSVAVFIRDRSERGILFVGYTLLDAFVVFLFFLPALVAEVKRLTAKMLKVSLSMQKLEYVALFLLLVAFAFAIALPLEASSTIITVLLLLFFYVSYILWRKSPVHFKYSAQERRVVLVFLVIAVVFGFGFRVLQNLRATKPVREKLFGVPYHVIMLPYDKFYGEYAAFEAFGIRLDFPLFIDDYLVFHPGFLKIYNKNALDFVNSGSYLILSGSEKDVVASVLKNKELGATLASDEPSRFFYVDDLYFVADTPYFFEATFDCSKAREVNDIFLEFHSNEVREEDTKKEKVMRFPGCREDNTAASEVKYKVPLESIFVPRGFTLLQFSGVDFDMVKDLALYKGNEKIPLVFLKGISEDLEVAAEHLGRTTSLEVYSFGLKKPWDVVNERYDEVDIAQIANQMKALGLLRNPFRVWTSGSGNIIIVNNN